MLDNLTAHRTLVTEHKNLTYDAQGGRVTVRKQSGQYIVTIERYHPSNTTPMYFKTMRGAMIAFDGAKDLV